MPVTNIHFNLKQLSNNSQVSNRLLNQVNLSSQGGQILEFTVCYEGQKMSRLLNHAEAENIELYNIARISIIQASNHLISNELWLLEIFLTLRKHIELFESNENEPKNKEN